MMIRRSRTQPADIVGIDIADDALRVLELRAPAQLLAYAQAALPPGVVVNEQLRDPAALAAAIRRACSSAGIRARRAALAVPTPQLISRRVELPAALSDAEYRELLAADPDWQRSAPDGAVHFDFVAGRDDGERCELRVFATASSQIDARCAALQLAGLDAAVLDVESFALQAALSQLAPAADAACALLNVHRERSSLLVVHRGEIVHLQQLSGSRSWLDERGQVLQERLQAWCSGLQAMQHSAPQTLLLAGDGAQPAALAARIASLIGLPCTAARFAPQADATAALAYGLARRGLEAPQ